MAYEITATKFRPQSFDNLVGQEFVTETLKNSIQSSRIANAYLLSGPRGVGKTSTARIIAKALNCINGPTATPCNVCENCIAITQGNHTDVLEVDGASNTSINDIRVIQEEIMYPPVNSKYKVYIIDEVHMLSKSAFNALLKTIEEPPKGVVFIFATTEINKVIPTIRSRCQLFNLRLIPTEVIYNSLKRVLQNYDTKYEENAIKWVAIEGKGSLRDSYTLLDQVISFCNNDITLKRIQEKLGLVGEENIAKLIQRIINKDRGGLLLDYYNILNLGISPEQVITELIKYFRNLLFKKLNLNLDSFEYTSSVAYSEEILSSFSFDNIENIIEVLFQSYEKTRYSVDIKIEIESLLLKLLNYKAFIRPKEIIEELTQLRELLTTPGKSTFLQSKANNIFQTQRVEEKRIIQDNINNVEVNSQKEQQNLSFEKSEPRNIKMLPEKSDIIKTIKSRISPTNIHLLNALNNICYIEEQGNTMKLFFSHKMYYDSALKFKDLLENEARIIIGKEFNIEIIFDTNIDKEMTVSERNIQKIKNLFNGKEFN